MKADRVHEQHKADDVHRLGNTEALIERTKSDADEKHCGDTQAESEDLYLTEEVTESDDREEEKKLIFSEKIDNRLHFLAMIYEGE